MDRDPFMSSHMHSPAIRTVGMWAGVGPSLSSQFCRAWRRSWWRESFHPAKETEYAPYLYNCNALRFSGMRHTLSERPTSLPSEYARLRRREE